MSDSDSETEFNIIDSISTNSRTSHHSTMSHQDRTSCSPSVRGTPCTRRLCSPVYRDLPQARRVPVDDTNYRDRPLYRSPPRQRLFNNNRNNVYENSDGDDRYCRDYRSSRVHTPALKPDPYSGEESWEEYHSHFENCADLGCWTSYDKLLYLSACLKGQARSFYMSLDEEKRDYCRLVERLRQRFGSSTHAGKYLRLLETRVRQPGESIVAFCDDLRRLAKRAYGQLDSKAQEMIALSQLYKVISVEMSLY